MSHSLIAKVPSFLARLKLHYDLQAKSIQSEIIDSCQYHMVAETEFDNWNGGTYGHDLILFLPIEKLARIDIDEQEQIAEGIRDDLTKLGRAVENEWFRKVRIELGDEADFEYQQSVPFAKRNIVDPRSVSFWKPGLARLFISHRDKHKANARLLGEELEGFGISSFVAHDTIQPMSEWRTEIIKGLETMEVMLVFLTDDFDDSIWCNQEVGFALGKGVPIVSLKLGRKDPPGFIDHIQAIRGSAEELKIAAKALFPLIGNALGRRERFQEAMVSSFVYANNWNDVRDTFDRMTEAFPSLSLPNEEAIVNGFRKNDQLRSSAYLTNNSRRLLRYLRKATGKDYEIEGRELKAN